MSAKDQGRVQSGKTTPVLFWCGVALMPFAVVVLLIAEGSTLMRGGVILVVLAVALIGTFFYQHGDGSVRADVEEMVFGEIDTLREDIRGDISHAAKITHKTLAEKIVAMNDVIESLRGDVDLLRGQLERAGYPASRQNGAAYGVAPRPNPGGVLHHTETVQVTTRKTTVVDQNERINDRGSSRRARRGEDSPGRAVIPHQRMEQRALPAAIEGPKQTSSWTQQQMSQHEYDTGQEPGKSSYSGSRRAAQKEDPLEGDVSSTRVSDRWTSAHKDEQSREAWAGERISQMRTGHSGSEIRIEDRWAAVRGDGASGFGKANDARAEEDTTGRFGSRRQERPSLDREPLAPTEQSGGWSRGVQPSDTHKHGEWSAHESQSHDYRYSSSGGHSQESSYPSEGEYGGRGDYSDKSRRSGHSHHSEQSPHANHDDYSGGHSRRDWDRGHSDHDYAYPDSDSDLTTRDRTGGTPRRSERGRIYDERGNDDYGDWDGNRWR